MGTEAERRQPGSDKTTLKTEERGMTGRDVDADEGEHAPLRHRHMQHSEPWHHNYPYAPHVQEEVDAPPLLLRILLEGSEIRPVLQNDPGILTHASHSRTDPQHHQTFADFMMEVRVIFLSSIFTIIAPILSLGWTTLSWRRMAIFCNAPNLSYHERHRLAMLSRVPMTCHACAPRWEFCSRHPPSIFFLRVHCADYCCYHLPRVSLPRHAKHPAILFEALLQVEVGWRLLQGVFQVLLPYQVRAANQ